MMRFSSGLSIAKLTYSLNSRGIKVHQKVGNEAKGGGRSNVKTVKRKCCMLLYFNVEIEMHYLVISV